MCGIAGTFGSSVAPAHREQVMRRMLSIIRHRGPDEFGIYADEHVSLGSARLSIIDLSGGQQPIANEDKTLWIVFNGEIFNHPELRCELVARGHRFSTRSDTEVILHLYEELGPKCLDQLNGQWAIAIWNTRDQELFLARDRLGVRPLFYATQAGRLIFASEIKAILAEGTVAAALDPAALSQTFTFWAPQSPRTAFRDVFEVPPGHYMVARGGKSTIHPYWALTFTNTSAEICKPLDEYVDELKHLLVDATRIRLRADVPVGAYLSGGLDSSTIASVVRNYTGNKLDTFSIAFTDEKFDESAFQRQMAGCLGTHHQVIEVTHADIGRVFPEVVWHAETPLMRTAPAPMFMLSGLVRGHGYKVVLTGEGADEFLGGYDIFKEAKVRRFWAQQPNSQWRPLLLKRLYPDIPDFSRTNISFLAAFFRDDLGNFKSPDYSHAIRWRNTRRAARFFSEELRSVVANSAATIDRDALPAEFNTWDPLARAQYIEVKTFLSPYLLSSQGDRMAMAHSVEGRFPFLDYRVVEFCNELPPRLKLRGLNEKFLLKKLGQKWLPSEISRRRKRPYRAPVHRSFFNQKHGYVRDLLSENCVRASGYFRHEAVSQFVQKIEQGGIVGETDDMAIVGIISTLLLHHQFVENFQTPPPLSDSDNVKVIRRTATRCSAPELVATL